MNLKTVTAVLTAALLAVGMTACNRNAGTGSSSQYGKKSGSMGSSSGQAAPGGAGSGSSSSTGNSGASGNSK